MQIKNAHLKRWAFFLKVLVWIGLINWIGWIGLKGSMSSMRSAIVQKLSKVQEVQLFFLNSIPKYKSKKHQTTSPLGD